MILNSIKAVYLLSKYASPVVASVGDDWWVHLMSPTDSSYVGEHGILKAVWKYYRNLQYLSMSILMWEYYFIIKIDLTFTIHAIEWIQKWVFSVRSVINNVL